MRQRPPRCQPSSGGERYTVRLPLQDEQRSSDSHARFRLTDVVQLDNGVRGGEGQSALVLALDELDVTLVTPRRAPRVLHQPVWLLAGGISVSADEEDTMVEVGATRLVIENTTVVELEAALVSLDGDGDGLVLESITESILVAGGDVGVLADGADVGVRLGLAGAITSGVLVVTLLGETLVLHGVLEGVVHQTTVAALVALRAGTVDQLLLGDGDEVTVGNLRSTFLSASGGEGPA
jgi:hypothetical protein